MNDKPLIQKIIITICTILIIMIVHLSIINLELRKMVEWREKEIEELKKITKDQVNELLDEINHLVDENEALNKQIQYYEKRMENKNELLEELKKENEKLKKKINNTNLSSREGMDVQDYVVFEVTAYTANYESTGKYPSHPAYGITASGKKAQEGRTLACPKSLPFGTKVHIPYFNKTFICEDRGGAITEGKLDVYMDDLNKAKEFGRRKLKVKVLD